MVCCLCGVLGGQSAKNRLSDCYSPIGSSRTASRVTRVRCSRDSPGWQQQKPGRTLGVKAGTLDIKIRAPDMCKSSSLGDSGAVEGWRVQE